MSYLTNDSKVNRIYSNFRGADFRGEEINLVRSPDCLNVWKNYKQTESIETRPGMKLSTPFTEPVYGIFFYNEQTLVHSGNKLYKASSNATEVLYTGLAERKSQSFVYEEVFYLKDGLNYLQYDGETIQKVVGFIPTTTIARKPLGGGTTYQDVNMLSPYRKNSFLADGASFSYFLDVMNIDSDEDPIVTVNDKKVEYTTREDTTEVVGGKEVEVAYFKANNTIVYKVFWAEGKIVFTNEAPDNEFTDGRDNVFIQFKKTMPKYTEAIEKCSLLQVFDNRVFFSGNPDYPNMVWHCSLNDPSYVSDLDYYKEGMDTAAVRGLVAGNNALWVFREPSDANTTVFYHTPASYMVGLNEDDVRKVYPSTHSSITTGCVGAAVNFNDDIVFFSERGMEGISGDVTTEQAVAHRSSLVDRKMITEKKYKDMVLAEWESYLLVFIGNKVYLADSRAMFQNETHLEYEWFYWDLEHEVKCAVVKDGILYLGTDSGVYTLTDTEANVESYWVTPLDKFKNPNKLKTTNKRGCVGEAEGDIAVYAKLEDTGYELIGTYNDIKDYFVCRIKRKKFKDLQLKFYSQTRFRLETVTLEIFVGGYIKR